MAQPNYIDVMLSEGNLLNDIKDLFGKYGWEMERYFKRTVFDGAMACPQPAPVETADYNVCVTEHLILKHPSEKIYYGFAVSGSFSLPYKTIPKSVRPITTVEKITNTETTQIDHRASDNFKNFAEWATNKWPPYKKKNTLYVYMTEKVHADYMLNQDSCFPWEGNLLAASLDLDVIETGYQVRNTTAELTVFEAKDAKRSPVAAMRLRTASLDVSSNPYGTIAAQLNSNWHADSKIEVKGILDEEKAMLIWEADASAAYENNDVPTIPFYIGSFDALAEDDEQNFCLTVGSAHATSNPTYDYDSPTTTMGQDIQPLLQKYPSDPSNGVDNIMVYRNRKGAYYQKHYLYIETVPNTQEPARSYNGRDYVRAWQRAESDVLKYQFNASRYDDRVKTSYAYIAHSDEGLRGKLSDIIVCNPISIVDYTTLKHRQVACPDVYDDYTAFVTGAVSTFTKLPGTPYHSLAIGILTKKGGE